MTVAVPGSYNLMRIRLVALLESREFNLRSLAAADPGFVQSRLILLPSAGLQGQQRADFLAATESGDILRLLRLEVLPEVTLAQQRELRSDVEFMLHGIQRRERRISAISANMQKLDALLAAIKADRDNHKEIVRQLLQVPLGDAVGCICPPAENHWHTDANCFDLIAYEIIAVNGLLWETAAALGIEVDNQTAPECGTDWLDLLQRDPYPTWKE